MSDYRGEARDQLQRSRDELASGNDQRIKYAALELRGAMESLTYDRALAYKDEFPPSEYQTWQPKKVMKVLLEIDPNADKDSTLAFGVEPSPGATPEVMHMLGTEKVLNFKTLKKHYDALGSYLHVKSIKQRQTSVTLDYAAMRKRCEEIAAFIEDVLRSPVFNSTISMHATMGCTNCGKPVRKRWPHGKEKIEAKCFECGAVYLVEDIGGGECRWEPDCVDVPCANEDCGAVIHPFRSEVELGRGWNCSNCGGRNVFKLGVVHLGKPAELDSTPTDT